MKAIKVQKRRRREFKTDYSTRIKLLKSNRPRLVFRRTNKYFIVQYVISEEAKDKILFGITSKELLKYSWPENFKGSLRSIPSAYLTGYLVGNKIKKEKLDTPIVDFGMLRTKYKSRVFSFLKGLIDSGLKLNSKPEVFPEEGRIKGEHLKENFAKDFEKVKLSIGKIK